MKTSAPASACRPQAGAHLQRPAAASAPRLAQCTSLYVMWSSTKRLSKIGIAYAPHSRASQLRREKADDSIRLMTCWNIVSPGQFIDTRNLEMHVHGCLRSAGLQDPGNDFPSEWFVTPWPAAVEFVEQFALLWAPCGVLLSRMPGNHG